MTRTVRIYLHLVEWRIWPWWSKADPNRLFFGPIVVTWYAEG